MKKLLKAVAAVSMVVLIGYAPMMAQARGGGGRASVRTSTRSYTAPKTTTTAPRTTTTTTSRTTTTKTVSTSTRPTTTTRTVTSTTTKTVSGKTYSRTGNVVDEHYQPHFVGGYVPHAGDVVYYRESSFMDWLPFYLILTNQQHREAVVETPGVNGAPATQKVVQEEGTDTMYVINWIVTILLCVGVIALVMWLANKASKKRN